MGPRTPFVGSGYELAQRETDWATSNRWPLVAVGAAAMALPDHFPKILVLIRTSLRPDCDLAAYEAMAARMNELVSQIPGYLGVTGYTAQDGENVAMVEFESREALLQWRDHPEHLETQRAGREKFYANYDIRIYGIERAYDFSLEREPKRSIKV